MAMTKFQQFAATQEAVTMKTHPTLLVDIAMKLGIEKPGADKERLVKKVNDKLSMYWKQIGAIKAAGF